MKQLFVSDLDGTLLNRESRVSDRSAAIISRLTDAGALISVATARTPATVEPLLRHTRTSPPAVVMTGAALWDRAYGRFLNPRFISAATASLITEACLRHGITPFIYTIGENGIIHTFFSGTPNRKERKFIDERSHLKLKRMHLGTESCSLPPMPSDPVLIFALGPTDEIYPLAEELRQSGVCSVSSYPDIFNSDISYLEVFAPGVDKAAAVTELKNLTGAGRLTVFGDNLNDIPMMKAADVAVAVDNALPQVKEAADIVIGPNTDDSVARYMAECMDMEI